MKTNLQLKLISILYVALVIWYSFYVISPPEVKPSAAQPSEFSAERAFSHIQHIAREPRPLGSAANDSTRAYLIRQLREMGLQPVVQEGVGTNSRHSTAGYARNILAELPGTGSQKAIMLMAHYDSVPVGPGAGDDASGVSTILEALRAITSGDTLQHDILVLFTDGEERGLLGADLFIDQYSDREQIDLVINMEARGTSGSSIMFETSVNNAALIPHFAQATSYPVANSLTYTVYTLLPNDTDLSVMKRADINGLNYAIIDGFLNYHTMQDTPEKLSLRSLQHHGENLLSNIRYFGNVSFSPDSESDYVYFNNLAGGLAYYPADWSFPLAVITGLIFSAYLVILFRRNRIKATAFLLSILSWLLILIAGALITYYGWQFIRWLHPEYQWLIQGETYNHSWYLYGFSALTLALVTACAGWLMQKLHMNCLLSGIYTLWILLSLTTGWYLPTAAYLFTWPALFGLLGWIATESSFNNLNWKSAGILWLSLLPALFIISPYIKLIQVALTTSLLAVSMVLLLLLAGLCLPLLWQITRPQQGYWAGGLTLVFLLCGAGAALNSGYDASHKKQNTLMYLADLDKNRAYWVSRDHTTDSWTSQFLGENPSVRHDLPLLSNALSSFRLLSSEAPILSFKPAVIQIEADSSDESLRYLSLNMYSPEPAIGMHLKMTHNQPFRDISLFEWDLPEQQIRSNLSTNLNQFFYFADQSEPVAVNLVIPKQQSDVGFEITYIIHNLPAELMDGYEPRKPYMMPAPKQLSHATLWKKTYWLSDL